MVRLGSILFLLSCSLTGLAQTLTVSSTLSTLTIHPGDTGVAIPVTLGGSGTNTNPVSVTLIGLPSGITVTPLSLVPGGSGTLQMSASLAADQEAFPATQPFNPDTATSMVTLVAIQGANTASGSIALTVSLENPAFTPAAQNINLPIVQINTGGVGILSKTVDVPGTITITSSDGTTMYLPGTAGTDNTATFQVHGNTTSEMPKLPYGFKLTTSTDLLAAMGLSCGYVKNGTTTATCDKSKTYILLANYDDKSMLRDWAASALANSISIGGVYLNSAAISPTPSGTTTLSWWAPHSLFVELYLNGVYEGTYQLIEDIKVDSHRVNINEMAQTDVSGKALTGGYLMEIDRRQAEDFDFVTPQGVDVGLLDPDYSPEVAQQTSYISAYVDSAEASLFASSYTDPILGWRAYFDEASLVNYYIVNDVMGNEDAGQFYSSVFLYKDKSNALLYMGPVWDFDLSVGNDWTAPIQDPTVPWMATANPWYPRLFSDPGFLADVKTQWNAMKNNGVFTAWLASVNQEVSTLEQTQQNNFGRWPMLGVRVWPNPIAVGSYDGEVALFNNWINVRMGYLDALFNSKLATSTAMTVSPSVLRAGVSTTLTATVSGTHPTGNVAFSENMVVLGEMPVNANGVATLTTTSIPSGSVYLTAYYTGDTTNGVSGTGVTENVLAPLVTSATNLTATSSSVKFGDSVTLTAVTIANSGGVTTGSVNFLSNGVLIGTASLLASGASLPVMNLSAGVDSVTAVYAGDDTYGGSNSNALSVTVAGIDPQLAFAAIATHTYGDAAFPVSATTNSTGALVYSVLTGPAAIWGNVVTLTGAGTVELSVSQSAAGNYAASSAQLSFVVNKAIPVLVFVPIASHTVQDAPFTVSASSASSGAVTYSVLSGPATIIGNLVTLTGIGVVTLSASQATLGGYDVGSAQTSFAVVRVIPTMTFNAVGAHTFGDASFAVSATSTSKAPITYSVVSGPATIAAGTVTITGAGTVVLEADQDVFGDYDIATAQTSFLVAKESVTLNFATIPAHTFGDASFLVSATSASSGAVVYAVVSGPAMVTGSTVALTGAGTVVLSATQATTANYLTGSASASVPVAKDAVVVTLTASAAAAVPGQTEMLTATLAATGVSGSETGTVSFLVDGVALGQPVTVSGGVAAMSTTALLSGPHTITAIYTGDQNFVMATSAGVAVSVAALDFTLASTGTADQTVSAGTPASFTAQLAPLYTTYPGAVSFMVTGLPAGANYSVTPATLTAGGGTTSVVLTIQTGGATPLLSTEPKSITLGFLLLGLPLWGLRRRRSRRTWGLGLTTLLLLIGATAAISGCGGTVAPRVYPVTLTASSGTVQHAATFSLTVK